MSFKCLDKGVLIADERGTGDEYIPFMIATGASRDMANSQIMAAPPLSVVAPFKNCLLHRFQVPSR